LLDELLAIIEKEQAHLEALKRSNHKEVIDKIKELEP
jgi:hypothetical protein